MGCGAGCAGCEAERSRGVAAVRAGAAGGGALRAKRGPLQKRRDYRFLRARFWGAKCLNSGFCAPGQRASAHDRGASVKQQVDGLSESQARTLPDSAIFRKPNIACFLQKGERIARTAFVRRFTSRLESKSIYCFAGNESDLLSVIAVFRGLKNSKPFQMGAHAHRAAATKPGS